MPTSKPTPRPTFESCDDINFSLGLEIIVSNGCGLTDNECLAVREFVADVVEKTFVKGLVEMNLLLHGIV